MKIRATLTACILAALGASSALAQEQLILHCLQDMSFLGQDALPRHIPRDEFVLQIEVHNPIAPFHPAKLHYLGRVMSGSIRMDDDAISGAFRNIQGQYTVININRITGRAVARFQVTNERQQVGLTESDYDCRRSQRAF